MTSDRAELERDLRRVADRLRTAPLTRLTATTEAGPSPVEAARALLGLLADLAAGTESRDATTAPAWRPVPDAGTVALGDQVTVLGAELVAAIDDVGDDTPIWTRAGREPLGVVLEGLARQLRALRMSSDHPTGTDRVGRPTVNPLSPARTRSTVGARSGR